MLSHRERSRRPDREMRVIFDTSPASVLRLLLQILTSLIAAVGRVVVAILPGPRRLMVNRYAESVTLALDLKGPAMQAPLLTSRTLALAGECSPSRGVVEGAPAGHTRKIHRLAPAGSIGGGG